ncbi:hypothetical protein SEA_SHAM_137 [Streptomyces phage Sham]|nr:hypothetical protein SEA_SHAM_137 [Streptomyces phage Sham]
MALKVGDQIVVTQFVRKGIEYAGRKGFVEIVGKGRKITVLLYATDKDRECTIDMKWENVRKA